MLLVVLNATGRNLALENRQLEKSNRALAEALRQLVTEKEVGISDVCPANGQWVSSGFTTSSNTMQGMDSSNTCINAGLTMAEGVKLSVMNGNMLYVCCVPSSVEKEIGQMYHLGYGGRESKNFPDGCYLYHANYATLPDSKAKYACNGGDVMVGEEVCCPLAVWENFKW